MKEFTSEEMQIIRNALIEYEENHYQYEDGKWQNTINDLIDYFRKEDN